MIDPKHCEGCRDDWYNQNVPGGCWNRRDAQLVQRLLIPIDQAPPWRGSLMRQHQVPSCYRKPHFAALDPASVTAEGWRA
jgi:hypothetical protein